MRKISYISFFIIGLIVIFSAQELYCDEAGSRYHKAIRHIRAKQPDFAFMEFQGIVRDFPEARIAQKAFFAIGEYYYDNRMYSYAIENFRGYIKSYPDSKANIFAKVYLLKIVEEIKNPALEEKKMFEDVKKDIFSKPLLLLFREYKEASYISASLNQFKIRYYIDNIEVYRNGQLFIKITQ